MPFKYVSEPKFIAIAKSLLLWSCAQSGISFCESVCLFYINIGEWKKTVYSKEFQRPSIWNGTNFPFLLNIIIWLGIYVVRMLLITIENIIVMRRPNKQICIKKNWDANEFLWGVGSLSNNFIFSRKRSFDFDNTNNNNTIEKLRWFLYIMWSLLCIAFFGRFKLNLTAFVSSVWSSFFQFKRKKCFKFAII